MRPRDRDLAAQIDAELSLYASEHHPLPGIGDTESRKTFIEQILESIHRVKFVQVIQRRQLSDRRANPNDEMFDPLKAAILHNRQGHIEEAFWLVFLFVHFGRNARGGWRYAREVYGRLGQGRRWDWASISADVPGFRAWLDAHQEELKHKDVPGGFGNHRSHETLDAYSSDGTGAVVASYVGWVKPPRTHQDLFAAAVGKSDRNKQKAFNELYESMRAVRRFGRLARFDYLTMVGKLGLAAIEPGSPYIEDSTGPLKGARLLFQADESPATLDSWLIELNSQLKVGMQVVEDALCNWQKSPKNFKAFRG